MNAPIFMAFIGMVFEISSVTVGVLVVAAHLPELEGLRSVLGGELRGRIGNSEVVAESVGIGLSAAAAGTTALLQKFEPRCVVLVGTCGAYDAGPSGLTIEQVVVGRSIALASAAAVEGRGDFPGPMPTRLDTDAALSQALALGGTRLVDIATTLAITTDDVLARRMADATGCQVEHLEAFSVATACARQDVPLAVVLAVANRVGAQARDEWRRHHASAGKAATRHTSEWLSREAAGADLRTLR